MSIRLTIGILIVILSTAVSPGQTPLGTDFTYQGQLNNAGSPAGGLHDLRFRMYDALVGGAQVGAILCLDNVSVTNGIFIVSLDFGAQFAGQQRFLEIDVRQDTGLGCANPAAFVMLTPRQAITATPNALFALTATTAVNATNATNATTATTATMATTATSATTATNTTQLNGQPAAFYQNATNLSAGTLNNLRLPMPLSLSGAVGGTGVIYGENSSTSFFPSGVYGKATATSGAVLGVTGVSASTEGTGVGGFATATSGTTIGVTGSNASTDGVGVFGQVTAATGTAYGVKGVSASTSGIGVVGQASALTGSANGGYFDSASTNGRGVFAQALAATGPTYGGRFGSASTSGTGVSGVASATTGPTYGVHGRTLSSGPDASGVYGSATATSGITFGGYFDCSSTNGTGIQGQATATTGDTYGVYGSSWSQTGIGVYGVAGGLGGGAASAVKGWNPAHSDNSVGVYGSSTGTSGFTFGGRFESASNTGIGAFGFAPATTGISYGLYGRSDSQEGRGVYGVATSSNASGARYGVMGEVVPVSFPFARFALYAIGDSGASGSKYFRIDHPDDPTNKYLLHCSTEGPEAINFYRGTVMLDVSGQAVVELPHYFAKINKTPSYMLTAVGAPMPMLHVAREIDEAALTAGAKAEPGEVAPLCSFRIAGGAPGGKVSWRVEAVRNDKWAQRYGAPVEIEKEGSEKGTYQHPELYNQPPEKGMNYRAADMQPATPDESHVVPTLTPEVSSEASNESGSK